MNERRKKILKYTFICGGLFLATTIFYSYFFSLGSMMIILDPSGETDPKEAFKIDSTGSIGSEKSESGFSNDAGKDGQRQSVGLNANTHTESDGTNHKDVTNPDEIIIAAEENDGVALTRSDIESLHQRQMQEIEKNTKDEDIIFESEETGEKLSIGEVRSLHRTQEEEIRKQSEDLNQIILEEPGNNGSDELKQTTLGEIRELHKSQMAEIKDIKANPDEVVIDGGDNGAIVTKKEVMKLHEEQSLQLFKNSIDPNNVIVDGNDTEDGKDVTLKDVIDLHQHQE